jgi:hypothetical protein
MPRALVLILLLTAACGRRETVTGNWTGVAAPDAATPSTPTADQGSAPAPVPESADAGGGGSKAAVADSAPPPPGAEFHAPDAAINSPEVRGAAPGGPDDSLSRDAGPDAGDARPCPEVDRCD